MFTIHVYHHFDSGSKDRAELQHILTELRELHALGDRIMGAADDIKTIQDRQTAAQTRLATALSNVAGDVRELIAKATTPGGLSQAETDEVIAKGEAIAVSLETTAGSLEGVAGEYVSSDETPAPTPSTTSKKK